MSPFAVACFLTLLGCEDASGELEPQDAAPAARADGGATDSAIADGQIRDASPRDGELPELADGTVPDRDSAALDAPWGLEKSCGAAGGTLRIPDHLSHLADCTALLGSLTVSDTALTSLRGLDQLRTIAGSLLIVTNAGLVDVQGFARLRSIGGDLEVRANRELTTLRAFESLELVEGTVTLAENSVLEAPSLRASAARLRIEGNRLLTSLHDLHVRAQEAIIIVGNPALSDADASLYANDRFTSERMISGNRSPRDMPMRECGSPEEQTPASYQTLAGCTHLRGSLGLQDTSMENLQALGNLRVIAKDVIMFRPHRILDLSGFENLESVGGELVITHAERLQSLAGMERLHSVGTLRIDSNLRLRDVAGLSALETVTGTLSIVGNSMLPQAEAQSFSDALTVGGERHVSDNGI